MVRLCCGHVDENIFRAEEYRRAQNRVRQARLDQRAFEFRFAAEIFERRILRRIRDADVNDALDARAPGRGE